MKENLRKHLAVGILLIWSLHPAAWAQPLPWHPGALLQAHTQKEIFRLLRRLPPGGDAWNEIPGIYPVSEPLRAGMTSSYGLRTHPVLHRIRFHSGLDLRAPARTPVMATASGAIVQTGYDPGLGFYVRIRHGYGFETLYGHLSSILVRKFQQVLQGQPVGLVGSTGRTTGPHLHYGLYKSGASQNPLPYCLLLGERLRAARSLP